MLIWINILGEQIQRVAAVKNAKQDTASACKNTAEFLFLF